MRRKVAVGSFALGVPLVAGLCLAWPEVSPDRAPTIASDGHAVESGSFVALGTGRYLVQNANRAWSIAAVDADTLRFRVSAGDRWRMDPLGKERSEVAGPVFAANDSFSVSYDLMVEPGPANTADWMTLGQFHAEDLVSRPPLSIQLYGERIGVEINRGVPDSAGKGVRLYLDPRAIERGRYYALRIEVRFANDASGRLAVWRDGVRIVDYAGPIGYGSRVYWKFGIYREASPEWIAAKFRNMLIAEGAPLTVAEE